MYSIVGLPGRWKISAKKTAEQAHDQSWAWEAGGSINDRVIAEDLAPCKFGHMIIRIIHQIVACRRRHPKKRIFGGRPCPSEWGIISESVCDLANDIMRCPEWDPLTLHHPVAHLIPPPSNLPDSMPFADVMPTIVSVEYNDWGQADVYIDDTCTVCVDLKDNALCCSNVVPLAIHLVGRPIAPDEPLPREALTALNKLLAKAGLEETKILLGWLLDTRRLVISLPEHKFLAWKKDLIEMLK